ncbi:glycosyltransferase 4 family protein [Nanoarchaeota archaeon]
MSIILWLGVLIAFFVTLYTVPWWIKRATKAHISGMDMQKLEKPEVAEMGGIAVLFGFMIGFFYLIAMLTFYIKDENLNLGIFMAAIATIIIISVIGMLDDILGWKIGLKQWQKPLLTMIAAIPLIAVNAGVTSMTLPFIGSINLGLFYPIIIIPLIIAITSNGFNMVAGYNGLESGLGIIILTALGIFLMINNVAYVPLIAFIMVGALLAFWLFNKYPAKIFPGDSFTYQVGALIGVVAIIGNAEKALVILFIPYVIEFLLKLRGRFKKESFSKVLPDGSLKLKYDGIYGLEHFAVWLLRKIKKKAFEVEVVYFIYAIQLIFVLVLFLI